MNWNKVFRIYRSEIFLTGQLKDALRQNITHINLKKCFSFLDFYPLEQILSLWVSLLTYRGRNDWKTLVRKHCKSSVINSCILMLLVYIQQSFFTVCSVSWAARNHTHFRLLTSKCISIDINLEKYIKGAKVRFASHEITSREISVVKDSDREPAMKYWCYNQLDCLPTLFCQERI